MALASLVLGLVSLPTLGCLGIGAITGGILGVVALVRASREPEVYGGQTMAVIGAVASALSILIAPFVLGVGAAIAIPSFLRARVSANEAAAIGDLRSVVSAQHAYATENGGHFDSLECLATPRECIPGYEGPEFLSSEIASTLPRSGYDRAFHPGAPPDPIGADISPSSISRFAIVATPRVAGQTGVRAFCADATGRVCFFPDESVPPIADAACPDSCRPFS